VTPDPTGISNIYHSGSGFGNSTLDDSYVYSLYHTSGQLAAYFGLADSKPLEVSGYPLRGVKFHNFKTHTNEKVMGHFHDAYDATFIDGQFEGSSFFLASPVNTEATYATAPCGETRNLVMVGDVGLDTADVRLFLPRTGFVQGLMLAPRSTLTGDTVLTSLRAGKDLVTLTRSGQSFYVRNSAGTNVFRVTDTGNMTLQGNVNFQTDGSYNIGSVSAGAKAVYTKDLTVTNRPTFNGKTPWDNGNLVSPMTLDTDQTVTGVKTFSNGLILPDGNTLMGVGPGKNRIINGAALVQQRVPAAAITNGQYVYGQVDRFYLSNGANGTFSLLGESDPDSTGVNTQWIKATATVATTTLTGSNNVSGIQQVLEGLNSYDLKGRQVTLAFDFRSNVSGQFCVALRDSTPTYSCVKTFSYSTANVTQRVVLTFPALPTDVAILANTSAGLRVCIGGLATGTVQASSTDVWLSGSYVSVAGNVNWAGTANNFIKATNIQLEAGSVATPFERRPYGLELALCQRYYEKSYAEGVAPGTASSPAGAWDTAAYNTSWFTSPTVPFRVTKRAVPTVTFYSHVSGAAGKFYNNNASADVTAAVGGFTGVNSLQAYGNALLVAGQEYMFHWTASAEL
jgi:hypothetical protein